MDPTDFVILRSKQVLGQYSVRLSIDTCIHTHINLPTTFSQIITTAIILILIKRKHHCNNSIIVVIQSYKTTSP
ncbi:hypothetical protein VTJ04DRAFT_9142 [Mycothermus thermophilus]|uniref:uncharacterized protein n=1 Tax=Humicola insolens TaxID=85995 RepID=UPI003743CBF4